MSSELKELYEKEAAKKDVKSEVHEAIASGSVQAAAADIYNNEGEGGDEFMAVKPYLGAIHEPTGFIYNKILDDVPDTTLTLERVYGYGAADTRNNLFYSNYSNTSNEIVYFAAATNIVLDTRSNVQRFHRDHTDDIISLALHPNGRIAATGETGRKPKIIIWNTDNMLTCCILEGFHQRGVCHLVRVQSNMYMLVCTILIYIVLFTYTVASLGI